MMGLLTGGAKAGKKAAKNLLDMATDARMKRAAEQGYDSQKSYRGLASPHSDEMNPRTIWTTKDTDYASSYAGDGSVLPVHTKAEAPFDFGFRTIETEAKLKDLTDRVQRGIVDQMDSGAIDEDAGYALYQRAKELGKSSEEMLPAQAWYAKEPELQSILSDAGYDSIKHREMGGIETLGLFSPEQVRSTNAAFDPAKRNSANLLAGAAGTAGVGLLGAGASNKGYAAPPTANDIFAQYGNEQQIQPAQRPMLANAANLLATKVDTPLDGLLGKGWISEGVGGLLNKFGYDDERKYPDFFKAALDVF